MSYRNWISASGYLASFLQEPHAIDITLECAARRSVRHFMDVPAPNIARMCSQHQLPISVMAPIMGTLERAVFDMFQKNGEDAVTIIQDLYQPHADSPYADLYKQIFDDRLNAEPVSFQKIIHDHFYRPRTFNLQNHSYLMELGTTITMKNDKTLHDLLAPPRPS